MKNAAGFFMPFYCVLCAHFHCAGINRFIFPGLLLRRLFDDGSRFYKYATSRKCGTSSTGLFGF